MKAAPDPLERRRSFSWPDFIRTVLMLPGLGLMIWGSFLDWCDSPGVDHSARIFVVQAFGEPKHFLESAGFVIILLAVTGLVGLVFRLSLLTRVTGAVGIIAFLLFSV